MDNIEAIRTRNSASFFTNSPIRERGRGRCRARARGGRRLCFGRGLLGLRHCRESIKRLAATVVVLFLHLALYSAGIFAAAVPYRLNRTSDTAAVLNVDNSVSVAFDPAGTLHVAYTDLDVNGRSHVYYRTFKNNFWSIPLNLSADVKELAENRAPQIVFDPATSSIFAVWLAMTTTTTENRAHRLAFRKIDSAEEVTSSPKIFDYGTAGFAPKVALAPGKIAILSEERPHPQRTTFRIRTFLTQAGEWLDNILDKHTKLETVTYPVVTTAGEKAFLFWVSTTVEGFDVMSSELMPEQKEWSEPKPIYRSPAPPEALHASGRGNVIALGWSLRGGPQNSILIQMVSRDVGKTWRSPGVLYSVAANAGVLMHVVSDTEIAAFIDVMDQSSQRLRFKYTVNAGESWIPAREIDAVELGPGKKAKESRRMNFASYGDRSVMIAWEQWQEGSVTLLYKVAGLANLASAPARSIPQPTVSERFSYYPQVWSSGKKLFFTYGNKPKLKVITEQNVGANDLYLVEVPVTATGPKARSSRGK